MTATTSAQLSNFSIVAAYREKTPGSERLAREAAGLFPSGVTHDSRYIDPYGIYVERARGSRKWDVDGNEYVDYFGGHGALLLGHNHPEVLAATREALNEGTHFGANTALEIRWAEAVRKLMPGCERLRFTSSGTEATHLALRLARAHTAKRKLIRLEVHFHGWHDHVAGGVAANLDAAPGVVPGIAENVIMLPPGDVDALHAALEGDDDVAAMILEPTGAYFGSVPLAPEYLAVARELTARHGVVLIFDEVVTGFRVSPGGAQGHFGVTPDLTALAKILAGGLPGGAVAGRAEIIGLLDHDAARRGGRAKIPHYGTFNASPTSAAAGIAALGIIGSTDACARANDFARRLRDALNEVLEAEGVPWAFYGTFSGFHLFTNPDRLDIRPTAFDPAALSLGQLKAASDEAIRKLRLAMLVHGVDLNGRADGVVSAAHDDADLAATVGALRNAIPMLRRDGEI